MRGSSSISFSEFEALVEEALAELPEEFAKLLENISVVVEQEPSDDDRKALHDGFELLGLYRGVARPHRSFAMLPGLPDQIAIFRGPILRTAHSREAVLREVRNTVIHELGHYFGLSDDDMVY